MNSHVYCRDDKTEQKLTSETNTIIVKTTIYLYSYPRGK